jgi:hypothetical protein
MTDTDAIFGDVKYKFKTQYRDIYHMIQEKEKSGIFVSMVDLFLVAFSIGYRLDRFEKPVKATNHVNLVNVPSDARELIIHLITERYPVLSTADEVWSKAEEYAEAGIGILFDSLESTGYILDIDDIM